MSAMKVFESRGLVYWLRNKMYIALTNDLVSTPPIKLKGPLFVMPEDSKFRKIKANCEPNAKILAEIVDTAFDEDLIEVGSMESEEITFAGYGEPLLRYDILCEAAKEIKDRRHGVPLRVRTTGLIPAKDCVKIAEGLKEAGIDKISVSLVSDLPKQYQDMVNPTNGTTHHDVCTFIAACAEAGLHTTATAFTHPQIPISNVHKLAAALGADFAPYKYCASKEELSQRAGGRRTYGW